MPAFRLLNLYKTLQSLSTQNPKPIIICCRSCSYPRFPEEFHSISHRRFPYSTIADEPIASKSESISIQIRVRYPLHAAAPRLTVETVYEPATENGLHIKQEIVAGRKKLDPDVEKTENPSSIEMDSGVCENIKENSSIRGRRKSISTVHVCQSCGYSDEQWWKTCKQCGEVGTMRRCTTKSADRKVRSSWLPMEAKPIKLTDVYGQVDKLNWRIPLPGIFGAEVETVLGGGLVPGSLVLVGGDPGIGKSTLLVQIAALIAEGDGADVPARVFYVSGEESVEQIGSRADRLCIETEKLFLCSSTDIEDILEQAQHLSPRALIIDSIQTVHLRGVTGSPGGCVQVKKCTLSLLRFAKKTNIPVILIGHVTKTGGVAGPRVLEHIVDVVLYMEGEKSSSHRLLRSVKNRFGSTDELGVFKMSQSGLQGVSNPSEIFLVEQHSDSDFLPGLAVAVIMDGSRAFLIEIQASCVACSISQRHVDGAKDGRVKMIISVIRKQAGLQLENGIFVNVVGGVCMRERGGDLAIAAAICSSFFELPIPSGIAFIAEVGLGGELRVVHQLEKRINTVAKLGYKKCIVPKSSEKSFSDLQTGGMQILECKNLKEMINIVFRRS